jgi:hypothetical protein
MRTLILFLLLPLSAFAQETPPPPDTTPQVQPAPPVPTVTTAPWNQPQPVHEAVPVPRNWNLGAGISFLFPTASFLPGIGLGALASAGSLGGLVGMGAGTPLPRLTLLIERRLTERLFLMLNGGIGYSGSQSQTFSAISSRTFAFDASAGLRGIFNPGGIVEVSAFGSVAVAYTNYEFRSILQTTDSMGMSVQTPTTLRGNSYTVGGLAGLALERELISGLALRLSSSILGFSYNGVSNSSIVQDNTSENESRGGDVGLRFNPAIELRYAL